ncbi:MAG: hypothetical protein V4474_03105 [Patescibacteria group bacterium]
MDILLLFSFGGFLLWLPIVVIAIGISAAAKLRMLRQQNTKMRAVNLLFLFVPVVILIYGVWAFALI